MQKVRRLHGIFILGYPAVLPDDGRRRRKRGRTVSGHYAQTAGEKRLDSAQEQPLLLYYGYAAFE